MYFSINSQYSGSRGTWHTFLWKKIFILHSQYGDFTMVLHHGTDIFIPECPFFSTITSQLRRVCYVSMRRCKPEAGIKGRETYLHPTVSVGCNCVSLPLIPVSGANVFISKLLSSSKISCFQQYNHNISIVR